MYAIDHTVRYSEVSVSGRADMAQIACYFQDCASAHSDAVGAGAGYLRREKGCAWMLSFWQIEVERFPEYGEKLRIVTNPYEFDKVFAKRNFMLYDAGGMRIAAANSYWFMFDIATGHPRRLTQDITSVYELGEKQPLREYAPRMIRCERDEIMKAQADPVRIMRSYCDTNRHMNNVWYIRLGMELLPEDFRLREVRAEYRMGVQEGELLYLRIAEADGSRQRIAFTDAAGTVYAILDFMA